MTTRAQEKEQRLKVRLANEAELCKRSRSFRSRRARAKAFVVSFLEFAGVSTAAIVVMGFFALSILASLAISVAIILLFLDLIGIVDVVSWL